MKTFSLFAASAAMAITAVAATPTPAKAQADPYLGQMMLFGGNFCPRGWANADGQLLPIAQYSALFSLMGTIYGGDGRTTFGLPDLRGRAPLSAGNAPGLGDYRQGVKGGSTSFTLSVSQMPSHNHTGTLQASQATGDSRNPSGKSLAVDSGADRIYHTLGSNVDMQPGILKIDNNGGNQAVNKVSPYLVLKWCVALQGVFPSRN